MNRLKRVITIDKEIRFGQPVFKGTRIPVYHLFEYLSIGHSFEEFTKIFPSVSKKQAEEAVAIAIDIFYSGKLASFYETAIGRKSTRPSKATSKRSRRINR